LLPAQPALAIRPLDLIELAGGDPVADDLPHRRFLDPARRRDLLQRRARRPAIAAYTAVFGNSVRYAAPRAIPSARRTVIASATAAATAAATAQASSVMPA
jgi:hypothetical protein